MFVAYEGLEPDFFENFEMSINNSVKLEHQSLQAGLSHHGRWNKPFCYISRSRS